MVVMQWDKSFKNLYWLTQPWKCPVIDKSVWILLLLRVDFKFTTIVHFPCVQEYWGDAQEEANWEETDRIQDPCAQRPFPSHSQGNSRALLVAVTHTCTHLFYSHYVEKVKKILWFLFSVFSVHLESWRQSVCQRKQLVQGITEVLALLTSSPNRTLRFVCYVSFMLCVKEM